MGQVFVTNLYNLVYKKDENVHRFTVKGELLEREKEREREGDKKHFPNYFQLIEVKKNNRFLFKYSLSFTIRL